MKLDEAYDSTNLKISRYEVVLNRAWLLHWTLFIVFKSARFLALLYGSPQWDRDFTE